MKRAWRDYNLTIVAGALFLVTFAAWGVVEWNDFQNESGKHGKDATFGPFMTRFWAFTLENWQSEFLHIFLFVIMTAALIHKGSAESRDSDDRMEAALERIEHRLGRLEAAPSARATSTTERRSSATATETARAETDESGFAPAAGEPSKGSDFVEGLRALPREAAPSNVNETLEKALGSRPVLQRMLSVRVVLVAALAAFAAAGLLLLIAPGISLVGFFVVLLVAWVTLARTRAIA